VVWQSGFGDQSLPPDPARDYVLHQVDATFTKVNLNSLTDVQTFTSPRTGIEDQYFLAMFLFDSPFNAKVHKEEFPGPDGNPLPTFHVSAPMPEDRPIRVYVGPKDRNWLSKADPQLAAVINYGWFEFISKPLLFVLLWIHSYLGNFGWSIIILTLAINLLLFPLKLKQTTSMMKMQKIQPQMRTLQDKYKKLKANDPRRAQLQTEMMGLYKVHGVNPLGGCLPLLLQLPVFYGLYSMLSISIELRRAPWALWINDLSQHDPYYVLPILLAVTMFIIQKMTPTTVDPAQAKVMMIMPFMFAFMFLRAQAGLTLYWMAGNVVGIGQQMFINKYWSPQAEAKVQAKNPSKGNGDK
jgi:YidC/Oxa1 family membrane protein insertase